MQVFNMQLSALQHPQPAVDHYVELLCGQGCMKVSGYIEALQHNQTIPELAELGQIERMAVLDELIAVMSVYQGKCSR